jgi:hypothetical protein
MFFTILVFATFIAIVVIVLYIIFSGENDREDTTICSTCLYDGIDNVCKNCVHKKYQYENEAVEETKQGSEE